MIFYYIFIHFVVKYKIYKDYKHYNTLIID